MNIGERFLKKCLETKVETDPWPHQILNDTFDEPTFKKLTDVCLTKLSHIRTDKLIHIHPKDYKDYGIDFYDETLEICENLLKNVKDVHSVYPVYRKYPTLGVNAHISITPPLPFKFYIHQEGLEKTWSSVTYISPKQNVGTKMYTAQDESTLKKEAEWKPNSTFIFCGDQGKTWHSYESNQNTNRITFNLFIMKHRSTKCFYPL
jgi:hypothetical protein|tara:strand:+ start:94 stop:708 length:615 start_codon:yes stop_codon:yes gene_type:complete